MVMKKASGSDSRLRQGARKSFCTLLTSRKKAIAGAPKLLIAGVFGFVGDLHAGGNAYRW
jgi:hypothetical protein